MPPLEAMDRRGKAVLWPRLGIDGYSEPVVGDPVEIDVRWNDSRREMIDPGGNVVATDAQVIVGRDVPMNSILWQGEMADLPPSLTPKAGLVIVKAIDFTPDIKGRNAFREVGAMRYKDKLPWRDSLLTGLACFYRNGGTDRSGNGKDLTAIAGGSGAAGATTTGIAGVANSAMDLSLGRYFKGANPLTTDAFSWCGFVKYSKTPDAHNPVILQYTTDQGDSTAELGHDGANNYVELTTGTGNPSAVGGSQPGTNWIHLAAAWDGASLKLFVNGSLVGSASATGPRTVHANLVIGNGGFEVAAQFVGGWSRVLTVSEVWRLWNKGKGYDPTLHLERQ